MERKKQNRDSIRNELRQFAHPRGRGGRGGGPGRYWNAGGDFGSVTDPNQMHRQETLDKARVDRLHRVSTHAS